MREVYDLIYYGRNWYTCLVCGYWFKPGEWVEIGKHFRRKHHIAPREIPLGLIVFRQKQRVLR